jgi:protein-tyrosine phosphatase
MTRQTFKILFVCMGNICRSPTAEGVFRHKLKEHQLLDHVLVDSAGTHNYHPDAPPDPRSQRHARQRGYDLSGIRARGVQDRDFYHFDLLLTMDWDNRALLEERCPAPLRHKVRGFAEFLPTTQTTVIPDPYYGDNNGFEHVLDLIEEASDGLMQLVINKVSHNE